jgi:glycosyltransferase involved in cell wall biosynthesis
VSEPLRILQLNSLLTGGGTDDQCVKLAQALHALGQRVWIAGPDGREFSRIIQSLAIPFHVTPHEGLLKHRFIRRAAQFIRAEKIQIVHGHHGRDIWPAILAAKLSGARPQLVLTRHLAKSPGSWFSRRFMLGQCDAVIAVSEFVARVLREGVYEPKSPESERRARGPVRGDLGKIHTIHGGIDTDRFRPLDGAALRAEWGVEPGQFVFAVVGGYALPRGKGQREFLAAAARVHAEIPRARFLIVGRGTLAETLRADIARLGLTGKAWLTPYCLEMPAAMNAIDCLVHPAVGTEAFPGVVLEALACGKPVVASALDGIPEAFHAGAYGQMVRPDSIEELAAALKMWAAHPPAGDSERRQLHARVAERFSIQTNARCVLELYRKLVTPAE